MKLTCILLLAIVKQLSWGDFSGQPDKTLVSQGIVARTYTFWTITDSTVDGRTWYNIDCQFDKDNSWTVTDSENILRHEQTHYLISVLWFKKMRERIKPYQGLGEKYSKRVHEIYEHCWKECHDMQEIFDRDTKNSQNYVVEKIWEQNIRRGVK